MTKKEKLTLKLKIMIKFSKKTAFILMITITIGLGFSLNNVNWENINGNIYNELKLPSICLSLSIYFMLYYVKILKEEKK